MSTALLSAILSLALLSSGASVAPAGRSISLEGGRAFTNPDGTVDHDGAVLHSIDIFNKHQRNIRILNQTGALPAGWEVMPYKTAPASLQKRANGGAPLTLGAGPLWTAQIAIGTPIDPTDPPSTYTVLVDTGSCDLWVPDIQCGNACDSKRQYDSGKSTTSTQVPNANYMHSYGDGLKVDDGDVFTDVVTIAAARGNPLTFGTAKDVASGPVSYLTSPYDGILGLALAQLSELPPGTLPPVPALFAQHQLTANAFSLRLSIAPGVSELFLGGANPAKFAGAFETHAVVGGGFWQVAGASVLVNGRAVVALPSAVLDSGANYIFGDPASVAAFYADIPNSHLFDAAQGFYAFPCATQLPTIEIMFGAGNRRWAVSGATFNIGPIRSMANMCMGGVVAGGAGLPAGAWLLGAVFMQNVYTQFFPGTNMVGFATPV